MSERPWIPHDVEFISDVDRPDFAVALWAGHRWFGYDLMRWAKPQRVVELGAHYGCSFFAFCQAAQADEAETELVAIDTWEGDGHTIYDEDVFGVFTGVLERRFPFLNTTILRSTFDDALDQVADRSVDLLHIDGLHTYEAVRHDYETWLPKLAPNGIVLFHDVAPSSGLGSARFWLEVRDSGPSFAFLHSLGLGVLLPNGAEGRDELLAMARSPWRAYYPNRAGHDLRSRQVADLSAMIEARDEALAATEKLVASRDEALAATEKLVVSRDEALARAWASADDHDREIDALQGRLDALTTRLEHQERNLSEARSAVAEATRDRDLSEDQRLAAEAELEQLRDHVWALTIDRDAQAAGLERYRRTFKPVRWASRPPRNLLRRMRHRSPGDDGSAGAPELPIGELRPPPRFDPDWYLARYPDVARAGVDPGDHWVRHGWRDGREPCPLFSSAAYLEANPDVADAGVDPLAHWLDTGWREGRDPSHLFATSFYLERTADSHAADQDPLDHYLTTGLASGAFVSPRHEELVLDQTPPTPSEDRLLVDVTAHRQDGSTESLPYPMVADLDADLVTFDLWDTILTRTRPADAAKLATARRLRGAMGLSPTHEPTTWDLMRQRVEIEAAIAGPSHGEYLMADVLTRQIRSLAPEAPAGDVDELVDHLRRCELEDEMAGTTPLAETTLVMDKLLSRGDGTQVAVLSDFYLGGDDLRELLSHHGIGDERLDVISSADLGRSKHRNGELFSWAHERYGVAPERHVHIGDNPHADVAMQVAVGGTAVHLAHGPRRFPGPGQLDPASMVAVAAELDADLDTAARLRTRQAGLRTGPENRVIEAAWRTSLPPVALVAAAIEEARVRGLDRVHYISREGLFLSRVHEVVADILSPQGTPEPVHLAVSRRSTFGPSLTEITPTSLLDLWRMYSRQTPRGLLVSLGAEPAGFSAALEGHGLGLDEEIDGVHLDARIHSLLDDDSVVERLSALNRDRRQALLGYLGQQTDLDQKQLLVVDVGWRGTVQDNLARLLPETRLVGWYLALFPFLNPQPGNVEKFAIGPNGNAGDEFAHMEPPAAVERPWTPAAPSVVDYRLNDGGTSVPVLDEEILDQASRHAIGRYQDSVVEAAPTVARWIVANGAATDVLRPLMAEFLRGYYQRPHPGIADLWFDSAHDDTFGALNVTSFGKTRPDRSWFSDGLGPGFLRHLEAAASGSLWPEGYRRWLPVQSATVLERSLRSGRHEARR